MNQGRRDTDKPANPSSPLDAEAFNTMGAMSAPDKDIPVPTKGQRSSSFAASVFDLEVGQSASKVERVESMFAIATLSHILRERKERMRNGVASTVAAAKAKTGGVYSIEVSELITTAGNIYVVVIISRLD